MTGHPHPVMRSPWSAGTRSRRGQPEISSRLGNERVPSGAAGITTGIESPRSPTQQTPVPPHFPEYRGPQALSVALVVDDVSRPTLVPRYHRMDAARAILPKPRIAPWAVVKQPPLAEGVPLPRKARNLTKVCARRVVLPRPHLWDTTALGTIFLPHARSTKLQLLTAWRTIHANGADLSGRAPRLAPKRCTAKGLLGHG